MGKPQNSNTQQNYYTEESGPKKEPKELWSLDFLAESDLTVKDGVLYISQDKKYYAIHAKNGKTLWTVTLKGRGTAPAIVENRLFIGGHYIDNYLHVLEKATGTELARYRTASSMGDIHATPIIEDGKVIFAAGKTIHALEPITLKKLWSTNLGKRVNYKPVISAQDRIFVGTDEGRGDCMIFCCSIQEGKKLWSSKAPELLSNLVYCNDTLVYTDGNCHLNFITSTTGEIAHSVKLKEKGSLGGRHSFLAFDGKLLLIAIDYHLHALDYSANQWAWGFFKSKGIVGQPVIADGCVYFANLSDSIFGVDLKSGEELFRVKTGVRSDYACGIEKGVLYFAASMGDKKLAAYKS
jgi:outer membrane protein assembly factor BamB